MVHLPLFKLAALFVRHISKYGANRIKIQAHEHERFRQLAARYGQTFHQINMRMSVAVLRNAGAEKRAKEKAEAAVTPTAKTREQVEKEEREQKKDEAVRAKYGTTPKEAHAASATIVDPTVSVWRRRFRPLPEAKAVDLFADVIGDAFILLIASVLVVYEYYRSTLKPDANVERFKELTERLEELRAAEEERLAALQRVEQQHEGRILAMEAALRSYRDPKTRQPLLALPVETTA